MMAVSLTISKSLTALNYQTSQVEKHLKRERRTQFVCHTLFTEWIRYELIVILRVFQSGCGLSPAQHVD